MFPISLFRELNEELDALNLPSVCFEREKILCEKYPQVSPATLVSIIQYHYQEKIKKNYLLLRKHGDQIYMRFLKDLQDKKEKVAFNLSLEFKQPPYLVSQLILERHFSKCWEILTDKPSASHESSPHPSNGKDGRREPPNGIKRITPVQVNFKQEYPRLGQTCIKQKRVTPTAVHSISEPPHLKHGCVPKKDRQKYHGTTPALTLSLIDVMVVKTKKNKKNAKKDVTLSPASNSLHSENNCNVLEDLIQNKDKSKLFDRILNKTSKSVEVNPSLDDLENNNVTRQTPSEENNGTKSEARQTREKCGKKRVANFKGSIIPKTVNSKENDNSARQKSGSDIQRVTPKRVEPDPSPMHTLSSIHFMTQNCQSRDSLYEDYRKKLEQLNERFVSSCQANATNKCSFVSKENRTKIEKLTKRMNTKSPLKAYLATINDTRRCVVEKMFLSKIDAAADVESEEVVLREEDIERWKRLVRDLKHDMQKMVQEANKFCEDFNVVKTTTNSKALLKQMLRNPSLINDPIISNEIAYNNAMDDQYGTIIDLYRRSIGLIYENKIHSFLVQEGILLKSEKLCMSLGFDKTPDLIIFPTMYIDGAPVNWVESKAVFANDENHQVYEKSQYEPYFQRFGPGCVIYWFGYLDTIQVRPNEYIILEDLPRPDQLRQPVKGPTDAQTFLNKYSNVIQIDLEKFKTEEEEKEDKKKDDEESNKIAEEVNQDEKKQLKKISDNQEELEKLKLNICNHDAVGNEIQLKSQPFPALEYSKCVTLHSNPCISTEENIRQTITYSKTTNNLDDVKLLKSTKKISQNNDNVNKQKIIKFGTHDDATNQSNLSVNCPKNKLKPRNSIQKSDINFDNGKVKCNKKNLLGNDIVNKQDKLETNHDIATSQQSNASVQNILQIGNSNQNSDTNYDDGKQKCNRKNLQETISGNNQFQTNQQRSRKQKNIIDQNRSDPREDSEQKFANITNSVDERGTKTCSSRFTCSTPLKKVRNQLTETERLDFRMINRVEKLNFCAKRKNAEQNTCYEQTKRNDDLRTNNNLEDRSCTEIKNVQRRSGSFCDTKNGATCSLNSNSSPAMNESLNSSDELLNDRRKSIELNSINQDIADIDLEHCSVNDEFDSNLYKSDNFETSSVLNCSNCLCSSTYSSSSGAILTNARRTDITDQWDESKCSMCDLSVSVTDVCSMSHCTKLCKCFSSKCSDKLIGFSVPCNCDKNKSFASEIESGSVMQEDPVSAMNEMKCSYQESIRVEDVSGNGLNEEMNVSVKSKNK